ncbi:PorP/SprF family type IX secretion system membrane protein [Dawidia soli]|uniref:Type IX secretion system membrane protein PorP/SprF n=1 Tax=Dawidia soli TaxID=2782352 RepID=A0AAP2GF55_9BACT|nr:type IX secretion system membrane protein PorP/SprF [Dawidia soli]MBT1689137.1 type IX secretion system membrane protein PorP/SprF [Dawidia soli]
MSRSLPIILLILIVTGANAQQQPVLSQYMFHNHYFNPAYTGSALYDFSLIHRAQWSGYEDYTGGKGAPVTQAFTATLNLDSTGHGLGLTLSRDKTGLLNTFRAGISYAYRVPMTKKSTLAVGVRGGIESRSVDGSGYIVRHPDDPYIRAGDQRESKPDITLGVWLDHEKYYVGVSSGSLVTRPDYKTLGTQNEENFMVTAGYHFILSGLLKLTPSAQVITNTDRTLVQGGMMLLYDDFLWAGLYYRHEESASMLAGFSFLEKKFRLGYAFDYIVRNKALKTGTSHEIMLQYQVGTLSRARRTK